MSFAGIRTGRLRDRLLLMSGPLLLFGLFS